MGPVTGTGAAGPAIPALALATLSLAVLILVLDHRRLNLGWRAALSFLLWAAVYGWVRSVAIRLLAEARLAGVPYSLNTPLMTIAGVPCRRFSAGPRRSGSRATSRIGGSVGSVDSPTPSAPRWFRAW